MESNSVSEVIDTEVPLKTDDNQSDNGLDVSPKEEMSVNNGLNMSSSECKPKEESDGNDDSKDDKSGDGSRHQYSKDQLIQISKLSSARIRPKCLDNAFNNGHNGLWNPEKWISSRSSVVNTSNNKYNYNKKVNSDLKDRVMEEESDIVLSPQRGSFGTGCHVSSTLGSNKASADSRSRDYYSERNKSEESNDSSHRSNINTRRVGSGRIINKERERSNDWGERNSYDRGYEHRDGRGDSRDKDNRNDEFNDRRGGRYDRRPNREEHSNRNFRFESHRYRNQRYSRDEEENEPEWFTEGPTSKHDTIELKGFDDDSESTHNKDISEQSKESNKNNFESLNEKHSNSEPKGKGVKDMENELKSEDFDVNAMFKTEDWFGKDPYETPEKMISTSTGISENVSHESDVKSRSKRWFKGSPNQAMGSLNSELSEFSQNNENMLKKRQKEDPIRSFPSNTQMSNPISPDKIFEFLSNGSNRLSIDQMNQKLDPTKAMSLAEIEANVSKLDVNKGEDPTDDKRAFHKLLFGLNKKSTQSSNSAERTHNEVKNDTTLLQTSDAHIVIPNSMRNAPSILELLKEQENKEAMADLHRSNRRVPNQGIPTQGPTHPNGTNNMSQNSVNNPMFGSHSLSNSRPISVEAQNWQNNSPKNIRFTRSPSNQEMSEHTAIILHKALQNRQQIEQTVRVQPQSDPIRANIPNKSAPNFLIPTSVMRNMHSEKDRDSVKSVQPFSDMNSESNSSQNKFLNENFISKPSPMRPIVKSNNPIGQSVVSKQSPLSPHSDSMSFIANNLSPFQSNLLQQSVQQNQSSMSSYQRPINSSSSSVRPFNLGQSSLTSNSTPSPNAINNIGINSNQHILQMFNNPNVRTNVNQMQMSPMVALQQNSASDGHQSQYSQSRGITASNFQQMLLNSRSDSFPSYESEAMRTSVPTTYSQPRLQMQQMFQNSGPSQPNPNSEPRFFGQIFGQEVLHHEMPTVPLHNALTLDDLERS